jgi:alanine racemase
MWQLDNYTITVEKLKGIKFLRHIANSSGTVNFPISHMDMVRCGLAAWGNMDGFKEALSWKTKIVFLKYVKKGSYISYSKTYRTQKRTRVATIPLGYGDGYMRALSNRASVLINGKRARMIGNITMDMSMIDVTDIDAKIGDEVIIIGKGKNDFISAKELALKAGTIPYEITTMITSRVPRTYVYGSKKR